MAEELEPNEHDPAPLIDFDEIRRQNLQRLEEIVSIPSTTFDDKRAPPRNIQIRRRDVFNLASNMASSANISQILGIDRKTCQKHFKNEILNAHAFARWKLQNKLFVRAMTDNAAAERIFAAKNWLGMNDNGMTEDLLEQDEGVQFEVRAPKKITADAVFDETPFEEIQGDDLE